jgi:DnaJ-class molecular chaperone
MKGVSGLAVCPNCGGDGKKVEQFPFGNRVMTCPSCDGFGEVGPPWDDGQPCAACDGFGFVYTDKAGREKGYVGSKIQCRACGGMGLD